ncbi:hypothetical protein E2562_023346 [Oryza meyeriana var. granulata]|uniref:Uncharacterized protein n=1 Tax=Oryza meyeriana var. granulata TaxID=110450 RepID=A0A6G1E1J1_9ORYZ|nr:hypothetical protein E2562_023346 [Oryza meyeriana var. granulata]
MDPLNQLPYRERNCKFGCLSLMSTGMVPYNPFIPMSKNSSDEKLCRENGIIPDKLLWARSRICRLSMPMSRGGIGPSSWFVSRTRRCNDDKLASDSGMGPVRLLLDSLSFWSRVNVLPSSAEAQVGRDLTGEGVVPQQEGTQSSEAANARRYAPMKPIEAQVKASQEGKVSHGRGDGPGEPKARQAERHHSWHAPATAADHALPAAEADAAVPPSKPGRMAADPCLESQQRSLVSAAGGDDRQHGEEQRRKQQQLTHETHLAGLRLSVLYVQWRRNSVQAVGSNLAIGRLAASTGYLQWQDLL